MRRQRKSSGVLAEINVVPYIDVMLVLLVIFMITTPLLTQGVKIDMPQAKAKSLANESQIPIVVSVDKKQNYYLNIVEKPDIPLPVGKLVTRVAAELAVDKEQGKHRQVLVKGDKSVDYGTVVLAMVMLQQAGVDEVGLMTEQSHNG